MCACRKVKQLPPRLPGPLEPCRCEDRRIGGGAHLLAEAITSEALIRVIEEGRAHCLSRPSAIRPRQSFEGGSFPHQDPSDPPSLNCSLSLPPFRPIIAISRGRSPIGNLRSALPRSTCLCRSVFLRPSMLPLLDSPMRLDEGFSIARVDRRRGKLRRTFLLGKYRMV